MSSPGEEAAELDLEMVARRLNLLLYTYGPPHEHNLQSYKEMFEPLQAYPLAQNIEYCLQKPDTLAGLAQSGAGLEDSKATLQEFLANRGLGPVEAMKAVDFWQKVIKSSHQASSAKAPSGRSKGPQFVVPKWLQELPANLTVGVAKCFKLIGKERLGLLLGGVLLLGLGVLAGSWLNRPTQSHETGPSEGHRPGNSIRTPQRANAPAPVNVQSSSPKTPTFEAVAAAPKTLPKTTPAAETPQDPVDKVINLAGQKRLTHGDLQQLDGRQLTLVRNGIFARHGRPFQDSEVRAYFLSKDWYRSDSLYSDSRLSSIERENASFILRYQTNTGRNW